MLAEPAVPEPGDPVKKKQGPIAVAEPGKLNDLRAATNAGSLAVGEEKNYATAAVAKQIYLSTLQRVSQRGLRGSV